ncbi:MAG TPA: autotransporter-associated beta strand repeat-containing protein [Tepidisphaeraceae bacterium]|nr:autotransporter-associated beta strand repeat-containing protein [Tepidisphaeraceae bacterium]
MFLSNPTIANTADFRLENAHLHVNKMADLGTGTTTLAGPLRSAGNIDTAAELEFGGATASSTKALVLDSFGGGIWVSAGGTNLTLSGVISESGGTGRALSVYGSSSTSVLSLTASNTYTGPTAINFGSVVSIPSFANGGVASPLGMSSSAPANLLLGGGFFGGDGTLRYTGSSASTDRGATLSSAGNNCTIDVSTAATVLTMSGQFTGPGALTKAGIGTLVMSGPTSNYANSTNVNAGTLTLASAGAITSSAITVSAAATMNINGSIPASTVLTDNGTTNFAGNPSLVGAFTRPLSSLSIGNAAQAAVLQSASTLFPEILNVPTLSFTGTGKLDLANNELTTTATPAAIRGNLAGGAIFTSRIGVGTTLGYADIGSGVTEVRYALRGDATLNGTVDVGDLGALATNYGLAAGAIWSLGDFNYDGAVDVGDLGALATNYGTSLGASSSAGSNGTSLAAPATTAASVPEPKSLGMVAITVAVGAMPRRRNRRCR